MIHRVQQILNVKEEDLLHDYTSDLDNLFQYLAVSFDPTVHFHICNQDDELPEDWGPVHDLIWSHTVPDQDDHAPPNYDSKGYDSKGSDLDTIITLEQHVWAAHLINSFGLKGGFVKLGEVCCLTVPLSSSLIRLQFILPLLLSQYNSGILLTYDQGAWRQI